MPYRLEPLYHTVMQCFEGIILLSLLAWNYFCYLSSIIPEEDIKHLTGPYGVAFAAVVAVIVLWSNKIISDSAAKKEALRREQKEDRIRDEQEKAREARHKELVDTNKEYAEKLNSLVAESLTVHRETKKSLDDLTHQLKKRPCQMGLDIDTRIAEKLREKQIETISNHGQITS